MRVARTSMTWLVALVAILAVAGLSVGCGGGGGGGGAPSNPVYTYSGVVLDSSGNALPNVIVTFDSTGPSATTGASGQFSLSVPSADLSPTGIDTLVVTNSSGVNEGSLTLPAGTKGATGLTIKVGPPPPPAGL